MVSIIRSGKINICRLCLGSLWTNVYIAYEKQGEAILIDPAARAETIKHKLTELNVELKAILLTHGHFDHMEALQALKEEYGVPVYAHEEEKQILESSYNNLSEIYMDGFTAKADHYVKDGEELALAGFHITVIHTPGHTAGSVCYLVSKDEENVLFSGDTMFAGSFGRYDFPTGNYRELMDSIRGTLLKLDDKLSVYPGHNEETTIGEERNAYQV